MSAILEFPERDTVKNEALTWPQRARAAAITSIESYTAAAELLKAIKALRVKIAETFDPHVKRAHEAHRALVKEKADAEAPLTEAELILKRSLTAYDDEQRRIARERQAKADREAREQEEQRRLDQAAAMEKEGNEFGDVALVAEANALISEPVVAVAAPVEKATPKVAGIAYRTTYSAQVVDILALVRHVAANPQLLPLLSANMPALNGQARSLKAALQLPGVKVIETRDVAAGRG